MCPEIWQSSSFKPLHHDLPFASETLDPVETLQPAQESWEALLKVARLFIFIICLLQQQPAVCVCVGVSFDLRHLPIYPCPSWGLMIVKMTVQLLSCSKSKIELSVKKNKTNICISFPDDVTMSCFSCTHISGRLISHFNASCTLVSRGQAFSVSEFFFYFCSSLTCACVTNPLPWVILPLLTCSLCTKPDFWQIKLFVWLFFYLNPGVVSHAFESSSLVPSYNNI